jgi:hypothetical protein
MISLASSPTQRQAAIPEHARTMPTSTDGCTTIVSPQIGRYRRLADRGSGEDERARNAGSERIADAAGFEALCADLLRPKVLP